jgi:hypothetical protein
MVVTSRSKLLPHFLFFSYNFPRAVSNKQIWQCNSHRAEAPKQSALPSFSSRRHCRQRGDNCWLFLFLAFVSTWTATREEKDFRLRSNLSERKNVEIDRRPSSYLLRAVYLEIFIFKFRRADTHDLIS